MPQQMFQAPTESKDSRINVAKYWVQDCNLVKNLMVHLKVFPPITEMRNALRISFQFVLLRGQHIQCK